MNQLNTILIEGNITRNPEVHISPNGVKICKIPIAVNRFYKNTAGENVNEVSYFDIETMSGLKYNEIEGLILRNNKEQYQLIANNTDVQLLKGVKKMYRDIVLSHLAKEVITDQYIHTLFNSKKTYLEKVCEVFLDFVNVTDVFTKYKFDEEDFLPPMTGYFGELDIESLPIEDVKTICKVNKVTRNILRMLLHTFTNPISSNKFSDLSDDDATKLNMLTIALKYKNFAELAIHSA